MGVKNILLETSELKLNFDKRSGPTLSVVLLSFRETSLPQFPLFLLRWGRSDLHTYCLLTQTSVEGSWGGEQGSRYVSLLEIYLC